jgi:CRISPR-associated protein Cas6
MHQLQLSPGSFFPEDGGYLILSGLSRQFPFIHGRKDIQIAPVRGTRTERKGWLKTDKSSVLHIRGLASGEVTQLSKGWFQVEGNLIGMGLAEPVVPSYPPTLASRLVVFDAENAVVSPEWFLNQLARVAPIGSAMTLGRQRSIYVKGRAFRGYGVHFHGLSPSASEWVQSNGIGRFTSMGCGVFAPSREQV